MRHALVAILLAGVMSPALAQDVPEITVRPQGQGYVGPYGADLPGVAMFAGREAPPPPLFAEGGVPIPSRQRIPQEYTYQDPLPPLDAWHGTLSPGIPF